MEKQICWQKELFQAHGLNTVTQKYHLPLFLNRCSFSGGERQKGKEQSLMHRMNGDTEYGSKLHYGLLCSIQRGKFLGLQKWKRENSPLLNHFLVVLLRKHSIHCPWNMHPVVVLLKRYDYILTPETCKCNLIWKKGFYRYSQDVKMRSLWVIIKSNDKCPYKRYSEKKATCRQWQRLE